jgi:hypothetical protein
MVPPGNFLPLFVVFVELFETKKYIHRAYQGDDVKSHIFPHALAVILSEQHTAFSMTSNISRVSQFNSHPHHRDPPDRCKEGSHDDWSDPAKHFKSVIFNSI